MTLRDNQEPRTVRLYHRDGATLMGTFELRGSAPVLVIGECQFLPRPTYERWARGDYVMPDFFTTEPCEEWVEWAVVPKK